MAADDPFFLGVDGGATRCRARLRDSSGALLAQTAGPAANIYVDYASALSVVRAAISEALDQAGLRLDDSRCVALGLGLAGLSTGAEAARIVADLATLDCVASVRAANDAVTACLGAHAGADGGIVIAGTGSAGIARVGGREIVIGGRGFLLGDDGSAARIGADAIRAAVRACDGLGPSTPLTQSLMQKFANDPHVALQWALSAKPSDYGAFAPAVLDAAREGDALGRSIVEAAASALAALTRAVRALGADRVALVGGLSEGIRPHLPADLDSALLRPLFDATDGAILLAGGILPASPNKSEGS
ncbi:BadF/BadG/BcrA/BcrD ATPase family protein [Methylocapsa sp. S129]|uniref:BadF/BadG/BcrA/BcrD ATPase family protein n=1 Tax=Methylocapsa sp. S129 TaxID=1641869 RepID=UPI00131B6785|nr:BadF/BadG/BcrA/BcrD ATPase family protein [Methylocapsa sp. S129]